MPTPDELVQRMLRMAKVTPQDIVYDLGAGDGKIAIAAGKAGDEPVKVLKKCLDNIKPMLEVKSRRVGGSTYQVPVEVRPERRISLAMRWLVKYSNARSEKTVTDKLAGEILDAYNNRGSAVKKREDTHKMAEANRAFAHYRW